MYDDYRLECGEITNSCTASTDLECIGSDQCGHNRVYIDCHRVVTDAVNQNLCLFQTQERPPIPCGAVPLCSAPSPSVKAGWSGAPSQAAVGRLALTAGDGVELRGAVPARNRGPVLRLE